MTNQEAIKELEYVKKQTGYADIALDLAIKALEQQPKTGHWIRQTDDYHDYYECEYCGIAVGLDDIRNYCPNCGAKMESEDKE